jgi:CubicO group peptidase (beta-lactamase class C family)
MDRRWVARASKMGVSALFLASACSGGDSNILGDLASASQKAGTENAVYPTTDWEVGDPAELGFDPAKLEQIAAEANPMTNCLLVIRHGKIAGEWYWNGWTQENTEGVMSVTQAYSSTLVGLAQTEGFLDIDDKVSKYIPQWQGTDSEDVTIRDILSHVSGRESTNSIGNAELHGRLVTSPNPGEFAETLPQEHEPGTVWSQNLPAIELLNPILQAATGMDPAEFAQQHLFGPIGATHSKMGKNPGGVTWMHSFLETSCRDAARFGYLYLRQGNWNGQQVLSKEWVKEATHPSQDLNRGWGLMWWLNEPGSLVSIDNVLTPDYDEPSNLRLNPDAPEDMFWALGFGGRFIQVDPATDTVVVRLGGSDGEGLEAAAMQLVTRVVTEGLVE